MKTEHILCCLILILVSCTPDDDTFTLSEGKIRKIVNEEGKTVGRFFYNRDGLLKESREQQTVYPPDEDLILNYFYNEHDLLIKKTGFEPGNMLMSSMTGALGKDVGYTYEYDDLNRLDKKTIDFQYNEFSDLDYSIVFDYTYPETDLVVEKQMLVNPMWNSMKTITEYHFNSMGNIDWEKVYVETNGEDNNIYSLTEYTYDENPTFYSPETGPVSRNNVIASEFTWYHNDEDEHGIAGTTSTTHVYAYNNSGYPISQTTTYSNEIVVVKFFIY